MLLSCLLPPGTVDQKNNNFQETMRHGQILSLPVLSPDMEYYWSAAEEAASILPMRSPKQGIYWDWMEFSPLISHNNALISWETKLSISSQSHLWICYEYLEKNPLGFNRNSCQCPYFIADILFPQFFFFHLEDSRGEEREF